MKISDIKRLFLGLNRDDSPAFLKDGEYVDGLNIRTVSSEDEQESGQAETLRGEVEILIDVNADITYYGSAIGGEFQYSGYEEVTIGSQVWMKNNWDANYPGSKVYDDDEANRAIYGGLYTWDQVMAEDFVPDGWRVPTEADVDALLTYLGGALIAGGKMKEPALDHWLTPNTGADDSSGFKGLGGGKYAGAFDLLQEMGLFWIQEEEQSFILAGTSPSGLILKSIDNGVSFVSEGSAGHGNPLCFYVLANGDILYGTDTGFVVNYTKGTSVLVSTNIQAIGQLPNGNIYAGGTFGQVWESVDGGVTFPHITIGGLAIRALIGLSNGTLLMVFSNSIQTFSPLTLRQMGAFSCAVNIGGGILYAGGTTGHVWRSIDLGTSWTDLGDKTVGGFPIVNIVSLSASRIGYVANLDFYYTDDDFASFVNGGEDAYRLLKINETTCLGGISNGFIWRSIDNGITWTEIAGNPQQAETGIGCLVKMESLFAKQLILSYNDAVALKDSALKSHYLSVRLIKEAGTVNPLQDSVYTNVLLNGKCIDPETRCLYVFYIDTYYGASWIIEINLDNRVQTVVYFDKYNAIGFDPLYKIYNARVVHGKLVWTDKKNPIYQMDIARAKKSFYYKIGYGYYPEVTEWSTTVTYGESQVVSDGNYFFRSVGMGNLNHQPKTDDGTYWTRLCLIEDAYYSMDVKNFYFEPAPPKMPPTVEYIADENRRINSLKQTLFQFAYRYIYMDWRKSTFSPASIVALPSGEEEANTGLATEQISINNGLKITVNTGGEEVRAIEIIARSSVNPSKWFLIETINKFDEEERAGEVSLLEKLDKLTFTITMPAPVVSNINIADPDGPVPFTISIPAPSMLLYYIDASAKVMSWTAIQSGAGEQIASVITVFGGHPSTQIEHIPAWLTCIETGGGLPLIEGDPITDGMEIALYPTANNAGPYQSDNFKISDVYLNFVNIFVEQAQPLDVPVVNPIVHPESPNAMTLEDVSADVEVEYNWFTIVFTPNHPSYGPMVNFTMNYEIWRVGLSGSGSFMATNLQSNSKMLLATGAPIAAGETIFVYLWEGTIT